MKKYKNLPQHQKASKLQPNIVNPTPYSKKKVVNTLVKKVARVST